MVSFLVQRLEFPDEFLVIYFPLPGVRLVMGTLVMGVKWAGISNSRHICLMVISCGNCGSVG